MEETTIIFGNGEETTSNTKAHIGELEAIVCNDNQLTDDLVAIHPIVDAGYDIHLSSKGGVINKPSDGHSFPILRDGLKWMIDLEELKEIKIKRKPIYCNTVSIASQVLRLHERMGYPSSEAIANPEKNDLNELKVGELLSGDIIGKIQPATRNGDIYSFLWIKDLDI